MRTHYSAFLLVALSLGATGCGDIVPGANLDAAAADARAEADAAPADPDASIDAPADAAAPVPAQLQACMVGGTAVYFDGDSADYIHPGMDLIVDAAFAGNANGTLADRVHVDVTPTDGTQGLWWDLTFSSQRLNEPLAVGRLYEDAQREPFADPGHPGLEATGDGRGCNRLSGRFYIHALELNAAAELSYLAAWYEQHCEEGVPQLRGCVVFER